MIVFLKTHLQITFSHGSIHACCSRQSPKMANTYSITTPITYQQDIYPSQISALAFDPVSDVLWAGNGLGQVAAFYRNRMRGVVFPVGDNYVSSLYAREQQVYAMTMDGRGLGAWGKGGANIWHYR